MDAAHSLKDGRPVTVTAAIICVAVALAGAPLTWVFTVHWDEPTAVLLLAGIGLLLFLLVRALNKRRNWARWLIIVWTAIAICSFPQMLRDFTYTLAQVRSLIQFILFVSASILLLCPPSGRWYSPPRDVA